MALGGGGLPAISAPGSFEQVPNRTGACYVLVRTVYWCMLCAGACCVLVHASACFNLVHTVYWWSHRLVAMAVTM